MKLINDNCYAVMDKMIENGEKVDLIIIDPPYDISVTNGGGSINTIKKFKNSTKEIAEANIDKGYDFATFIEKAKKIQDKLNIYFFTNKKYIPMYFNYFFPSNKYLFDILFWNKRNAIPSYNNKYLTDNEYIIYIKEKGAYNKPQNYEDAKTAYLGVINHKDKKKWEHPSIKPLKLVEKLVRNSCPEGGLVADFFMGSGTTGLASKNNNRDFIGVELEERYFKIANQRILGE